MRAFEEVGRARLELSEALPNVPVELVADRLPQSGITHDAARDVHSNSRTNCRRDTVPVWSINVHRGDLLTPLVGLSCRPPQVPARASAVLPDEPGARGHRVVLIDIGDSPALKESNCARALSSDAIVNMNELVREIGINYQKLFDDTIDGHCNREQVVSFLRSSGEFYFKRSEDYSSYSVDYFDFDPRPFPLNLIGFEMSVNIMSTPEGEFLRSNWSVSGI